MAAPTSLTITPPNPTMIIGGTQGFTAVDQTGTVRPDATWSISDTSIASFESDSPNTLLGNAAGTATVTATVGTVTGQTTIVVLPGSPSIGTVLWSAPTVSGFSTVNIVQAAPTPNGPDLYTQDVDGSDDFVIRAFKSDGEQLWQQTFSSTQLDGGIGDNFGGLIVPAFDAYGNFELMDLDPVTSTTKWTYSDTTMGGAGAFAVGADGTIYGIQRPCINAPSDTEDCLASIDGTAGTLKSQVSLPTSNTFSLFTCATSGTVPGTYSAPIVGPDGATYMEAVTIQITQTSGPSLCNGLLTETISLLKNGSSYATLATNSALYEGGSYTNAFTPGDVIPDGNGGIIASFKTWSDPSSAMATIANTNGVSANLSSLDGLLGNSMVLGDNDTAFITDGREVISFNTSSLAQNWTYPSTGGSLSLVAATSGSGVTINDSEQGIIQLTSNGTANTAIASLEGAHPVNLGDEISGTTLAAWSSTTPGATLIVGAFLSPAPAVWIEPLSDLTADRAAAPVPAKLSAKIGSINTINGGQAFDANGHLIGLVLYGYSRYVIYTALDSKGNPIKGKGSLAKEDVDQISANPSGGTRQVAKTPVAVDPSTGEFHDTLAFFLTAPPMPQPGQYDLEHQIISVRTKAQDFIAVRTNCVDFEYDDVTLTDITENPNATCHR